MILLVDVGNSRIKWVRVGGRRVARSHAALYGRWRAADYRRLFAGSPQRALIASVAAPEVARALRAAARRARVPVTFVTVPRRAAGVAVGYRDPWRLGVDRFVALVGARRLFPAVPVLVAGIGTALTLDLLDAGGHHRGGVIVPGPKLMVESLLTKTHGIRRRARGGGARTGTLFGRSTREAIHSGALFAPAALIDRAAQEARARLGRMPLVVLMGGDAPSVRPLLASAVVGVPDLVLKGLAALATQD
ncbi:MAG TPA: type III pantothenate kinase [Steroidobacteraceae bacterium]|jgi:type III pantothenate kinase|nr:type III pantothenate kinase [Steroidobacteraceae bacterium]